MTKEEAVEKLKQAIDTWYEFWSGASYYISEETIEAIETLIDEVENK